MIYRDIKTYIRGESA